jgi:hypothetical protein
MVDEHIGLRCRPHPAPAPTYPLVTLVDKIVIETAKQGERDPIRLREKVVQRLNDVRKRIPDSVPTHAALRAP